MAAVSSTQHAVSRQRLHAREMLCSRKKQPTNFLRDGCNPL
ncbi:hypothetical protein XOC_3621 [Xanthomonas oryzae pv. oryzicola BLS256]|uniref:Uncharacterized protein n=1 Tax=Xanthomonas oryzae pv. oryzicola (strain BLS256) TaxID=383407 RepID=G7TF04_XANOB|nr:hypothetical protein XOC_3621 [Xanthomonas oryzae pv. oryzicola BLS256]QEO96124.1 hypothetical protein XOCgx_1130 [Xanthomonas oryzae pv. oryzicola]